MTKLTEISESRKLLLECAEIYKNLNRYIDKGRVELYPESGSYTCILFETFLDRASSHFYFRFAEPLNTHVNILQGMTFECGLENGTYYFSKTDSDGRRQLEKDKTLGMAVAAATGISYGSSQHIARLLFPEMGGFTFTEMRAPNVQEIKDSNGFDCWEISGMHPFTPEIKVVLQKKSLLIKEYWEKSASTGDWMSYKKHAIEASN